MFLRLCVRPLFFPAASSCLSRFFRRAFAASLPSIRCSWAFAWPRCDGVARAAPSQGRRAPTRGRDWTRQHGRSTSWPCCHYLQYSGCSMGFKCKQAVIERSHARGHSAKPPAAAAQRSCRRRSCQQPGACADDPHTNRKISRRPFSTCRTCWSTPKITYSSSPCAGACGL